MAPCRASRPFTTVWRPQAMPGTGLMPFDSSYTSPLLRNTVAAIHLLLDCAPTYVVCTAAYLRVRRWFSLTPERFRAADGDAPRRWQQVVSRHTDLCIDGSPGSGNTFVAFSLREALEGDWAVVSHMHLVMQLRRALAFDVPTVVLVRDPRGACDSSKSKAPQLRDWVVLLHWIHYHRFVVRHGAKLHVVFFEDVTGDVDLIRRVCPAVQRMLTRPLVPYPKYRNAVAQRTVTQDRRVSTRWLLAHASRLYLRLRRQQTERARDSGS